MIKTWGQTPMQIFTSPHPQSIAAYSTLKKSSTSSSLITEDSLILSSINQSSIHSLIFNVKWGWYVGSFEQNVNPACVHKESFRKNIVSLISLPSNEVIGLSQYKCLLFERPKETSLKLLTTSQEAAFRGVVEWCLHEDYFKFKTDNEKRATNLVPIRSNEQVNIFIKIYDRQH